MDNDVRTTELEIDKIRSLQPIFVYFSVSTVIFIIDFIIFIAVFAKIKQVSAFWFRLSFILDPKTTE